MGFSSEAELDKAFDKASKAFASNKTKSLEWRAVQLRKTWWMFEDYKDKIVAALKADLNKDYLEAISVDVAGIQQAALDALKKLKAWTADDRPERYDLMNFMASARVRKEPKGTVLIVSAWNYPFMELFEPMIAALAAGCSIVLKPSELAAASQDLIAEMVPQYLDKEAVQVITAGGREMAAVLDKPWNHIFFTGSTAVGKIVHAAAAEKLASTTLELGGQGPAIVTRNADVDLAAKRIAWSKWLNAGQVCVGVNHVLVDPAVKSQFIAAISKVFDEFLNGKQGRPDYYTHIVNERHFGRISKLLDSTAGDVVYGGDRDADSLFFGPTIVSNVQGDDSLMSEELFGPVMPVISATLDEAIAFTNARGHPLALYAFTRSHAEQERLLAETLSGGVTFNDCNTHVLAKGAPFGGVGSSGMGAYHGIHGFNEFVHLRAVTRMPGWVESALAPRYPPYTAKKAEAMIKMIRPTGKVSFNRDGVEAGGLLSIFTKWRVLSVALLALTVLRLNNRS